MPFSINLASPKSACVSPGGYSKGRNPFSYISISFRISATNFLTGLSLALNLSLYNSLNRSYIRFTVCLWLWAAFLSLMSYAVIIYLYGDNLPFRICLGRVVWLKSYFSTYFLTVSKSYPVILDISLKLFPSNYSMFLIWYICSIVSILSLTPFKYGQLKG